MEMKQYLIDTFRFNDRMNRQMLTKIRQVSDKQKCIRFFSHLINSQNKWMTRILQYPNNPNMDWWEPVYALDDLEAEWNKSLQMWVTIIEKKNENELSAETKFIGYDEGHWTVKLQDIALQLNYHSIHHRAQMQLFIREQGLEPDFIDYIGTKYRKLI